MNYSRGRKQIEATALNKVRKMFHPLYKFKYDEYDRNYSGMEQKYMAIESIFEDMRLELKNLDLKYGRWLADKARGVQEKNDNFTS